MTAEILVVGAGLAGAFAAERLARGGRRVRVLEARERVGGRAYARPFAGGAERLEFGGAWITPRHRRLKAATAGLGLAWRPRSAVTARRWYRDGGLHRHPAASHERAAHERAIAQVAADALAQKSGTPRPDLSFAAYLRQLAPPPATRALLSAWWCVSGNGLWDRVPAGELLASCGYHDGTPDGMIEVWEAGLERGMDALAAGLLASPGIALELAAPVAAVTQDATGVRLRGVDGRSFAGAAAILATGLNPLRNLTFEPPLPPAQRAAVARGHEGRAFKLWAEVEGVAPGCLATGGGDGLEWLFAERQTARGTTLLVGFGLAGLGFDPGDRAQVAAGVARFFPEARLLAHDHHDWLGDPFALGAWVATPLDQPQAVAPATWAPQGRLAFASSDFAAECAGWFEGAAASGEAAAAAILALP